MTGDEACDVILNRKTKKPYNDGFFCAYGNLYIADTVEENNRIHDDTGEDYCIYIQHDSYDGNKCRLYSRNNISFHSDSGGGLS